MIKKYFNLTYQQLLVYGVHLGHTFANSVMYTAWLVYTYRDNMLIMNIFKTFYAMKTAFRLFSAAVYRRAPIWFINLDFSAGWYSKSAAYSCGEFSWSLKWLHGLISNYPSFADTYNWLRRSSSEWAYKKKNKWINSKYFEWALTRNSWPRVVLVSSVFHSRPPVREALYLGIMCVGIVDTNINSRHVLVPVPGNDESLECLVFYADVVANYILVKKFNLVNKWFVTRKFSRLFTFKDWLYNFYNARYEKSLVDNSALKATKKLTIYLSNIYPIMNLEKNLLGSISTIFGRILGFLVPLILIWI